MRRLLAVALIALASAPAQTLRFAILGDRTGETEPGVYQQIWREIAAQNPAFVLSVGDTIQGVRDSSAESQWREWSALMEPWRKFELLLTPGNHDVWSPASMELYRKYSGRELHYSFDRGPVHITVLDNSRSDALPTPELDYLESDLKAHASQPVKIVVSHRPGWIFDVLGRNADAPLHQIAKKYGVKYVLSGHVHELLHFSFDGIEYVSVMSSGGHLRNSHRYEDGWFFGYAMVEVSGAQTTFQIKEAKAPAGQGRESTLDQWLGVGARR